MVYLDPDTEKVQFRLDISETVHPDLSLGTKLILKFIYKEFPYSHEEIGKRDKGKLIKNDVDAFAKTWAVSASEKRTRK